MSKEIRKIHPDWKRYSSRHLMAEDFWRGGFEVKHPSLYRSNQLFRMSDSDGDIDGVSYRQAPAKVASYLFAHDKESSKQFNGRNERARHFPVLKPILSIIYDGLEKNPVKRNGEVDMDKLGSDFWSSFLRDCSGNSEDFDTYKRDCVTVGMATGRSGTLIHLDKENPAPASEAHRKAQVALPYLQYFSAYNILNWSYDRFGRLRYVVLNEPLGEYSDEYDYKRKLVNDRAVITYVGDEYGNESIVPDETYTHGAGIVPFVIFKMNRYMDPYAPDLLGIDVGIYNDCSLLSEIDRNQTFSILAFPTNGGLIGGLDIGLYSALSYNSSSGSPMYLSPDAEIAMGLWRRIKEQFQLARTIGSVSRGMAEVSKEARSTNAMQFESDEKYNKMVSLAAAVERWENEIFRIISYATGESSLISSVSREFDVLALDNKINTVLNIRKEGIRDEVLKPALATVMKDFMKRIGVPSDDIESSTRLLLEEVGNAEKRKLPNSLSGMREQEG